MTSFLARNCVCSICMRCLTSIKNQSNGNNNRDNDLATSYEDRQDVIDDDFLETDYQRLRENNDMMESTNMREVTRSELGPPGTNDDGSLNHFML